MPPVGPGLTLHALAPVPAVPQVQLTEVRRFGGAIAIGAAAVREGRWPSLPNTPDEALALLPCAPDALAETGFGLSGGPCQYAGANLYPRTRRRFGQVAQRAVPACLVENAQRLLVWNDERERGEDTGLRLGEPVQCTRNLHGWGLQNGSIGRIDAIEDTPQLLQDANGEPKGRALAWVRWDDGERRPVTEEVLDTLELGYAVTVHKAQAASSHACSFPSMRHVTWTAQCSTRPSLAPNAKSSWSTISTWPDTQSRTHRMLPTARSLWPT